MDDKTKNPIIYELNAMAQLTYADGKQNAYFNQQAQDAKEVEVSSVFDVFTADEVLTILRVVEPKKRQCYRNSALMTELFPDRCKYVEGYGWNGIFKVEHAFNRVGDKYIDITWELALGEDVSKLPYVALIEADRDEIISDIQAHDNTTGDYYLRTFLKNSNTTRQ